MTTIVSDFNNFIPELTGGKVKYNPYNLQGWVSMLRSVGDDKEFYSNSIEFFGKLSQLLTFQMYQNGYCASPVKTTVEELTRTASSEDVHLLTTSGRVQPTVANLLLHVVKEISREKGFAGEELFWARFFREGSSLILNHDLWSSSSFAKQFLLWMLANSSARLMHRLMRPRLRAGTAAEGEGLTESILDTAFAPGYVSEAALMVSHPNVHRPVSTLHTTFVRVPLFLELYKKVRAKIFGEKVSEISWEEPGVFFEGVSALTEGILFPALVAGDVMAEGSALLRWYKWVLEHQQSSGIALLYTLCEEFAQVPSLRSLHRVVQDESFKFLWGWSNDFVDNSSLIGVDIFSAVLQKPQDVQLFSRVEASVTFPRLYLPRQVQDSWDSVKEHTVDGTAASACLFPQGDLFRSSSDVSAEDVSRFGDACRSGDVGLLLDLECYNASTSPAAARFRKHKVLGFGS
jgi:hypothetical protein